MIDFSSRVVVPETVLFRELDGESVLLNLDTESYLGLDDVGTRMWMLLTTRAVDPGGLRETARPSTTCTPEVLRNDVEVLLGQMIEHGLVELKDG